MNTISNDVTTWSPYFIGVGITTLVWGTEGIPPSGYIVVSANEENRIEEIDISQGAGFTAIVVLINDGNNVEITVIDDTAVQPPSAGQVASFSSPFGTINMMLVGSKADQARKREGMRTFTFKSYSAISGIH
jgi:hypothetical protein